jgi:hypothetical protein
MIEYVALISTYAIFGGIGYLLSRLFKKPLTVNMWIVLAFLTIFSQWVMVSATVVGFWEFKMYLNYSLQGFFGGILAGLSIRAIRSHWTMNEALPLLSLLGLLIIIVGIFVRVCVRLRSGGGSLTTTVLGATDGFLTNERSKAAETIVNENAGKKFEQLPSSNPEKKWQGGV